MTKYLFPGGNMPSIAQIGAAVEKIFVMEDWHLIGPDYDKTLPRRPLKRCVSYRAGRKPSSICISFAG
jgi:cyclopropane fatty-acyl-phospholipid synthase-like methyltransferase